MKDLILYQHQKIADKIDADFNRFMDIVYDGNVYDLPQFTETIDLIDRIWERNYPNVYGLNNIEFTENEKKRIYNSAKKEAMNWTKRDIDNSRKTYRNPARTYEEINKDLKKMFGIENKT